jgi:hypothetical protein
MGSTNSQVWSSKPHQIGSMLYGEVDKIPRQKEEEPVAVLI